MDLALITRLERVLNATWTPLEVEERDGWIVAANEGFTGRANTLSVLTEIFIGYGGAFCALTMTGVDTAYGSARVLEGLAFSLG